MASKPTWLRNAWRSVAKARHGRRPTSPTAGGQTPRPLQAQGRRSGGSTQRRMAMQPVPTPKCESAPGGHWPEGSYALSHRRRAAQGREQHPTPRRPRPRRPPRALEKAASAGARLRAAQGRRYGGAAYVARTMPVSGQARHKRGRHEARKADVTAVSTAARISCTTKNLSQNGCVASHPTRSQSKVGSARGRGRTRIRAEKLRAPAVKQAILQRARLGHPILQIPNRALCN